MTLAEALPIVSALTPPEKLQLIEALAAQVRGMTPAAAPALHREPGEGGGGSGRLFGILAGLGPSPSAEEIDQERREMWGQLAEGEP